MNERQKRMLKILKKCCLERYNNSSGGIRDLMLKSDQSAVDIGALTNELSNKSGLTMTATRTTLECLRKSGTVLKLSLPGYTCRWWPVGYAEEIKAMW